MVKTVPSGFTTLGINANDFVNNALADFGTTVTVETFTGTVDTFGGETDGSFASKSISAVFHERDKRIVRDPDGTIIESPAYLMTKVTDTVGTGDKVTVDGRKWRCFNAINRKGVFVFHDLYLENR